jgi:hypothetical protein
MHVLTKYNCICYNKRYDGKIRHPLQSQAAFEIRINTALPVSKKVRKT